MIDIQKQVWNMMKIAEETNMTITEMEEIILQASINNQTMNATNILGILLWQPLITMTNDNTNE